MNNVYFIINDPNDVCKCCIACRDTNLRIHVFNTDMCSFNLNKDEIQMYGYHNEKLLAFETVNIHSSEAMDIIEAIRFYAKHIKNAGMEILAYNPRKNISHVAI